jgi:WD40 repeat protein
MNTHPLQHTGAGPTLPGDPPADDLSLLGTLAEEFSQRVRQGHAPSVEEYARQHPDLAARICELFPTLLLLEGVVGPTPAVLAPGAPFGRYRIEREIGRGGMGVVYLAVHQALQKSVALKVLSRTGASDSRSLERFLREAQTAAALHHTNIVPVFDVGQVEGIVYYAMQYIDGLGLDQVLLRFHERTPGNGPDSAATLPYQGANPAPATGDTVPGLTLPTVPLPEVVFGSRDYCRWVAQLALQAAEGLAHAHDRGVIHRDVKPSNLLLDGRGGVWITDFGLAQRPEDPALTQPGRPLGTPRYMSPEQAADAGRAVDIRTDVYSLGVTLYELLAGRPAFPDPTPQAVLQAIVHRDPPPPRRLNPALPRDLETVVLKALAKRPGDRYASAGELADDLKRWLRHEPVRARRIGPLGRVVRWCRRSPLVAGLTLALAALLVTVAAGASALAVQERRVAGRERQAHGEVLAALGNARAARALEAKARGDAEAERDATARALRRAEGMRLGLQAQLLLPADPELALLLAVEGARRYRSPQADAALLAILDANRDGRTLTSPYEVRTAAFSRDGRYLLTTNGRGHTPVQLWDAATGKQVLLLRFPRAGWYAALSPDGKLVLTGGMDGTPRLWDASSGKELHQLEGNAWGIGPGSFSPDGASVVLPGAGNTASVWDTRRGTKRFGLAGHTGRMRQALFSPDGSRLVTLADDQTVLLWDATTGRRLHTLDWLRRHVDPAVITPPGRPHLSAVKSVEFSADGKRLLTVDSSSTARVWDVAGGKEVASFRWGVWGARLSPDGARVVTWMGGSQFPYLVVHDVSTGKEVARCQGHREGIVAVAFSPDGRRLASGAYDRTLRLWDATTGKELAVLRGHRGRIMDVAFSPDGSRVVSASDDRTARVWGTMNERERSTRPGTTTTQVARPSPDGARVLFPSYRISVGVWAVGRRSPRFDRPAALLSAPTSADGRYLLLGGGNLVHVVDATTGKDHAVLPGHEQRVRAAAFSSDGKHIVTGSADGTARVWSIAGKQRAVLRGHAGEIHHAAFDATGKRVVTAGADRTARVWDAGAGREELVLRGHADEVMSAGFGAGRVVTVGRDQTMRIWDALTGKALATITDVDWLRGLPLSPDGARVLAEGLKDRTAPRLYRLDTAALEHVLSGHGQRVRSGVFSPDSKQVVTADDEGTLRLWSVATGKVVRTLKTAAGGLWTVAFSKDGRRLVTAGYDTAVRVHDARTGKELSTVLRQEGALRSAAFTADGEAVVLTLLRDTITFWDPKTRTETTSTEGHSWQIWDAVYGAGGKRVVTASFDGTARVWDVASRRTLAVLAGHTGRIYRARFSPDDAKVVTASTDRTARVWDAVTGKVLAVLKGHTDEVEDAVFSADGARVLTRAKDATARLWDAQSGRALLVFRGHEGTLSAARFSPDGRRVLTASSGWAPARFKHGDREIIGSRVVKDHSARLWDARTGKELAVLRHETGVNAALFSPRGDRVLTGSGNVVRLWDAAKGQELLRWKTPQPVARMEWAGDGRVLTVGWNGPAQLWELSRGRLVVTLHAGPLRDAGLTSRGRQVWTLAAAGDFRLLPIDPLAAALRLKRRELTAGEREEFAAPAK